MPEVNCEYIRMAAMAVADGENPPLPAPEVDLHLATCDRCRSAVAELQTLSRLLDRQCRRERTEELWGGIADRLPPLTEPQKTADHWPWFLLLGLLVAGCRIAVSASDWEPGWWFKFAPVLLVVAVFALLRVNPFKVSTELKVLSPTSNSM